MRHSLLVWCVGFAASLSGMWGILTLSDGSSVSRHARPSELECRGGGGVELGRITMVVDGTVCDKRIQNCGSQCCWCDAGGETAKHTKDDVAYAKTNQNKCTGFFIYANSDCSGAQSPRQGDCNINWTEYVDP